VGVRVFPSVCPSVFLLTILSAASVPTAAFAQSQRPLLADSFRLGQGGGVLCQVQTRGRDPAIGGIFDRAWSIVCRDSARPVGKLYALRGNAAAVDARLSELRKSEAGCTSRSTETVPDLGNANISSCTLTGASVGYKVLSVTRGGVTWVAEGLSAYDSALKLGLRTVIADKIVPGKVEVATSATDDPVAFARVQAGTLDPDQALAEGYRRNNSGNYAEAAEFFDTLQQRASGTTAEKERLGEYLINRGLQKSNLGDFAEAESLFAEARAYPLNDRVQSRLRRNFEAVHLLNQQRYDEALVRLDQPVAPNAAISRLPGSAIEIGAQVAAEINSGIPINQRLGATEATSLTPEERAQLLDAQAMQLRGTLLRLQGKPAESTPLFDKAMSDIMTVRDGRVVSVIRLRSQILAEAGLAFEERKDLASAEAKMRESVSILETRYPQSSALNGARARLAAFLARHGKTEAAMSEYRQVMSSLSAAQSYAAGLGNLLAPYMDLLTGAAKAEPTAAADLFLAGQLLVRPGIADTQAILARELSEGSSEGSRLFRQARTLERDIERSRIEVANLLLAPNQTADVRMALSASQLDIAELEKQQTETQALLAAYPQFRAVSAKAISLGELKSSLTAGEAYFKLTVAGRSVYALFVDERGELAYKVPLSAGELEQTVDDLRDSIAKDEAGQVTTYAFDVPLARKLYLDLLGPAADRAVAARKIVFDPDGGMLRMPLSLLVASQAGADAYAQRISQPDADEFNFSGIDWFGKGRAISTTVSAKALRDARTIKRSSAPKQYLGLGQNSPVSSAVRASSTRSLTGQGGVDCDWPTAEWNKPISADELRQAQSIIGRTTSTLITGADFTDTGVKARSDLADYRILHFATHGLVTAPRPECPARPALLTSFGDTDSDGLLTFREIFDLKINADIVILSACDTAGKATVAATREAGLTSGGGNALDGLVRAFIGAGGRTVLASHWPAPDDYDATKRLIGGMFSAGDTTSLGDALDKAQIALMDDPTTSHPYYWAGFSIIGDGAQPLLAAGQ
jgi:CHAT domain-containing protein